MTEETETIKIEPATRCFEVGDVSPYGVIAQRVNTGDTQAIAFTHRSEYANQRLKEVLDNLYPSTSRISKETLPQQ